MAGRIQNLKPWKPGQSGNPGGRPKRDWAAEIARAVFERNADAIERAFARALRKGNVRAFKVLADRAYGRVPQQIEHPDERTEPRRVVIQFVKPNGKIGDEA